MPKRRRPARIPHRILSVVEALELVAELVGRLTWPHLTRCTVATKNGSALGALRRLRLPARIAGCLRVGYAERCVAKGMR